MTAKRLLLVILPMCWGFVGTSLAQMPSLAELPPASLGTGSLSGVGLPVPQSPGDFQGLPSVQVAPLPGNNPLFSPGTAMQPLAAAPSMAPLPAPTSTATLTAQPGLPTNLPPGSVASPWVSHTDPYCCGPTGANGPVTYELYTRTGPSLIVGGGPEFSGATTFGWMVTGGGRTLLFNPEMDAAWALDLGLTYAYNGANSRILDVFSRAPKNFAGVPIGPDQIHPFRLRGVTRTSLNYSLGRDWFLNGPGMLGFTPAWNSRFGADVGGRWGTVRVDLIPDRDRDNYARRSNIFHGLNFGAHYNVEVPMGNWIFFTGARVEYGFNWSNVVPPLDGNFQDLNLMLTFGVRF